jgi:hypothetical protein
MADRWSKHCFFFAEKKKEEDAFKAKKKRSHLRLFFSFYD